MVIQFLLFCYSFLVKQEIMDCYTLTYMNSLRQKTDGLILNEVLSLRKIFRIIRDKTD